MNNFVRLNFNKKFNFNNKIWDEECLPKEALKKSISKDSSFEISSEKLTQMKNNDGVFLWDISFQKL